MITSLFALYVALGAAGAWVAVYRVDATRADEPHNPLGMWLRACAVIALLWPVFLAVGLVGLGMRVASMIR